MKKIYIALCLLALAATDLCAQRIIQKSLPISSIELLPHNGEMKLNMTIDAAKLNLSKDREYVITPTLVSASGLDSVVFEPVVISGRNLYYRHIRNNDLQGVPMYRGKQSISYKQSVPLQDWMDECTLKTNTEKCGCCDGVLALYSDPIARIKKVTYEPEFGYVSPVVDSVKEFKLEGSAFINFPVNRTELYPNYMSNPAELLKITGTIDSVKNDPDVTITSIFIKGFASPEGPFSNNVRLAKGRTATLKQYVENLYKFPTDFIKTDYMPENWPGLRAYVVKSTLANRDGILSLIDSNMEPDAKNAKIESSYPADYNFLLKNVYPGLRRSDYVINYNVKSYTTLEEILRVLRTAPQKLSPSEFYRAAQSMTPGSDEYNEVFETAVRMYPADEVSNLNAANTAMRRGEYVAAHRYLNKAGNSVEVTYARGVLAALQKDYPAAESYFSHALKLGYTPAQMALEKINDMKRFANGKVEIIK
ncbi:MAG: tetratricopeptide repeat protein [Firmicutes bacterium]|nr:tetratricopeptide repeat protein [Bacillota bacterium]MCM1401385.1 tetratricopeptide repeat protein [Bacteroides sp.]MCM1477866.1 tetratricopeptide repeat protein [Bacteroides sp.]